MKANEVFGQAVFGGKMTSTFEVDTDKCCGLVETIRGYYLDRIAVHLASLLIKIEDQPISVGNIGYVDDIGAGGDQSPTCSRRYF